jgi:hypothetical protein
MIGVYYIDFWRFADFSIQLQFLFVLNCSAWTVMVGGFILAFIGVMAVFEAFLASSHS